VRIVWPDEIRYDKARLGGGRLAVAPGTAEDAVPDWMVFAAELIADRDHPAEPGRISRVDLAGRGTVRPGRGDRVDLRLLHDALFRPLGA
jgi:hypothetical protein